ncbi:hypothetical protein GmHk_15G044831 [Glycine max]|nr:hypothetical protein GmHk_15G044831 [Glycine max]
MLKTKLHAYIFKIYKIGNKKGLCLVMFVMVYSLLAVTTLTACYKQNGGVYLCNGDERATMVFQRANTSQAIKSLCECLQYVVLRLGHNPRKIITLPTICSIRLSFVIDQCLND